MDDMLFKTVHGSHLYNLAHEGSDHDYFTVRANRPKKRARYAKQKIHDSEDTLVMDFSTWLQSCVKGVPQALEAMFSEMALYDDIKEFREGYRVGTQVYETYLRTITNFVHAQDHKRKRHALRLAFNLYDLRRYGRFNPTLSNNLVDFITDVAHKDTDAVYAYAMNIALDKLPPGMVH